MYIRIKSYNDYKYAKRSFDSLNIDLASFDVIYEYDTYLSNNMKCDLYYYLTNDNVFTNIKFQKKSLYLFNKLIKLHIKKLYCNKLYNTKKYSFDDSIDESLNKMQIDNLFLYLFGFNTFQLNNTPLSLNSLAYKSVINMPNLKLSKLSCPTIIKDNIKKQLLLNRQYIEMINRAIRRKYDYHYLMKLYYRITLRHDLDVSNDLYIITDDLSTIISEYEHDMFRN